MKNEGQSKGKKPTKYRLLENKYNLLEEKQQASNRLTADLFSENIRLERQFGKAVDIIDQWQHNFISRQQARFNSELAAIERKPCNACSVINFNTFPLQMQGQLSRYSVSSFTAKHLMPDEKRITIEFEGERHRAVVKSIAAPCIYVRVSDATPRIGRDMEYDFSNPIRSQTAMSISPLEIAFTIQQSFSPTFGANRCGVIDRRPKNHIKCFGVLAFEGSLDDLKKAAAADQGRSLRFITMYDNGIFCPALDYLIPRLNWMFEGMKIYAEARKESAQFHTAVEVEKFPPKS